MNSDITWALFVLPNKMFKVKVDSYNINSDGISITAKDGTLYMTAMSNVLLMNKEPVTKISRGGS